jgi:hypothetical protein
MTAHEEHEPNPRPRQRVGVRENRPLLVLYLIGSIGLPFGLLLSSMGGAVMSAAYTSPMPDGLTVGAASVLTSIAGPLVQVGLLALVAAIAVHAVLWHAVQRDARSHRIIG